MRRILITVMMMFLLSVTVFGADDGFETEPKGNVKEAYEAYEISPVTKEVLKKRAAVFDVHSNGSYVVGCDDYDRKYVYVYTPDKAFWYGYSFSAYGSFELELLDDSLNVYLVRGSCIINLSPDGDVLAYETILDTQENNAYWNEIQKKEQKIGNTTYKLKEPFFIIPMYKKLVATDTEGNEEILYEGKSVNTRDPFTIFIVFSITLSAVSTIIKLIKKKKNKSGENKSDESLSSLFKKLEPPEYKAEDLPPPPRVKGPKVPPLPQKSEEDRSNS